MSQSGLFDGRPQVDELSWTGEEDPVASIAVEPSQRIREIPAQVTHMDDQETVGSCRLASLQAILGLLRLRE